MRLFRYVIFLIIMFAAIPLANAQDERLEVLSLNAMAKQLLHYEPNGFNYTKLKLHYIASPQYDPLGEDSRRAMLNHAYTVQTSHDSQAIETALEHYRYLVESHIANFTVINMALALSRQDKRFGDVEVFKRIRRGLFQNLLNSGDGMTLHRAYDIVSLDEESVLLAHLGYKPIQTKPAHQGRIYYNMHYVIEQKTNKPFAIFVDISHPMQRLNKDLKR